MRDFIKLFFYLFLVSNNYAQNKTVNINWSNSNNLAITNSIININGAVPFFVDESNYTEELITSWSENANAYTGSKAINVSVETVTSNFFNAIEKSKLPTLFKVDVVANLARDQSFGILKFNPLVYQNGVVKRIVSFDLKKNSTRLRSKKDFETPTRSSSVLASGMWKRFAIDASGVYKVTPQFLQSIGVNLNGVNPETIKIYGTGGKPLPYVNNQNRFYDIPEVPLKMFAGSDGVFSGADYLLFYGIGTKGYDINNDTNLNPFSDEAFYYVTTGGGIHKKISVAPKITTAPSIAFSDYDFETFIEKDLVNLGGMGRKWFGDKFDGEIKERSYNFEIPNPVVGSKVTVEIPLVGVYNTVPTLNVAVTGSNSVVRSFSFNSLNKSSFVYGAVIGGVPQIEVNAGTSVSVKVSADQKGDPSSELFLDYIRVFAKSSIKGIGKQFLFHNKEQKNNLGISEFQISNAQNISSIWNVTDPYSIQETPNKSSSLNIRVASGIVSKFLVVNENDFYLPKKTENSNVVNQDLKGNIFKSSTQNNTQGDVEYLIITRSDFLGAANRLADFRRRQNGYNAKVVTVEQIYNEFSTGIQDVVAIRNFIKYIYDNPLELSKRLKFVCFLGDGSYDYKNRIDSNTNIVPLYYALNSNSFTGSYTSDDFYGMMGSGEGGDLTRDLLDIAVGRMIAPNPEIANDIVDKVIRYYDRNSYSTWRNKFLFVSDDVDRRKNGVDGKIQLKLNFVANQMKKKLPNANVKKLFADAFKQEVTAAGARYPVVKKNLLNAFESGVSYINYFGHGGENGLSGEFIFRSNDARELTNRDRLTVFTTLTCELTRFDNPARETAGELLYWNKNGGAVALLTTTRNLFVSTGLNLNPTLADALFTNNQESIAIGEALRVAKNNLSGSGANKRTVFCVGDPALKIVFPKPKVILTEVNGVSVFDPEFDVKVESLKALSKIKLSGRVVKLNDQVVVDPVTGVATIPNVISDFDGKVGVVLFDKTEEKKTIGNDGVRVCFGIDTSGNISNCPENGIFTIDFKDLGNQVFNGQASVEKGIFDIEFVLSKNIKLPIGLGKVSFYAQDLNVLNDQSGSAKIPIGGLNTEAEIDLEPPLVDLFLNNENFLDGQLVNNTPNLIAKFSDTNGINTAGGVGHDILIIIDGDEKNAINLNEFYTTEVDDFTKGIINFRLKDLSAGEHTLKLRVSDVFNNVTNQEISFIVGDKDQFTVSEVLNYPNPFTSYTEFWFNHTGPQQDVLDVMVQVMTISGKIVTTKFATLSQNTNSYRGGVSWNGRDDFGNKVGKGVYVYKIVIKSTLTEKTSTTLEKLVVL